MPDVPEVGPSQEALAALAEACHGGGPSAEADCLVGAAGADAGACQGCGLAGADSTTAALACDGIDLAAPPAGLAGALPEVQGGGWSLTGSLDAGGAGDASGAGAGMGLGALCGAGRG